MASEEQVAILKRGAGAWNAWRKAHPDLLPDLSRADLSACDLTGVNLSHATLSEADLHGARLDRAFLREAHASEADFHGASLERANLERCVLIKATLGETNLTEAWLRHADLRGANVTSATLTRADLEGARLSGGANFSGSDLRHAYLRGASLAGSYFTDTNFEDAVLDRADLSRAVLVGANLRRANLWGCRVYGVSAWDVHLDEAVQGELVITRPDASVIAVDNLDVAQFIYLLLNNARIRHVIDTVTSKVVLILGRFTPERKAALDAVRQALRQRDYVPVIFDFEVPESRDTHETITTLARMARFVIADISDPKSIPQELVAIVEQLPSLPVQPILAQDAEPWGMYDHIKRYPWVLPLARYASVDALMARLEEDVIAPAEAYERRP